jgi:hypothetical protein
MPLTATFESGHNHFPSENIYFFMNDGNQRIRCGVSELALEVFDPKFQRTKQGRLQAFNKFRTCCVPIGTTYGRSTMRPWPSSI